MNFMNLSYLWAFSLLAPLILVYFLKVKPVKKITSAFFLWEEIIDQKKASQLFHKLKDLFSLLILLFAFLFFCTSLLNPVLVQDKDSKDLLLLVDNSLSMSTIENGKSRLELAKEKAAEIIKGMGLNRNAVLATTSHQIQYVVDKTNNLTLLKEGAAGIKGSLNELSINTFEAMATNNSILENYRVILITDGCHEQLNKFKFIEILKVGASINNIGITGFDIQRLPGKDNSAGVYLKLFNSSEKDSDIEIKLHHESIEKLFKIVRVTLKPGFNEPYIEVFKNVPTGKWIANLMRKDALADDNTSYAYLPEYEPLRILVKSENKEYFLSKCVKAFEDFKNNFVMVDKNPDIILTDNQEFALSSPTPTILFGIQQNSAYWQLKNEELVTPLLLTESTQGHRSMRYINPDTLKIKDCKNITLPKGVLPILEDENKNPVIFKVSEIVNKLIVLNFDANNSEFFLNINFPVMIHNICLELSNKDFEVSTCYQVGDFIYFSTVPANARVVSPTGVTQPISTKNFGPLDEKGFYQIFKGQKSQMVAVGVSPAMESNLANTKMESTLKPISSGLPVSYYLIMLAIVLVLIELILYHRRMVS